MAGSVARQGEGGLRITFHVPLLLDLLCRCLHFTWAARGAISLDGLNLEVSAAAAHCFRCGS